MRPTDLERLSLLLALTSLALPTMAAAQEEDVEPERPSPVRVVGHQQLIALLNPMGAEHRFDLGVRTSIGDQSDMLFDGAHFEGGAATALSPIYAIGGGYLELAPFSFLVLRGEVTGATVWPIGMSGAGYYGLSGYDGDVRPQALPPEQGGQADGWLATASVTLQGAVDLGGGARILALSELGFTHAVLGDDPFYYSMKHDLVLAREDFLLTNGAFVGLELRPLPDFVVRVGAYDDLRHVPASGYLGHQVGGIVMVGWDHLSANVSSLTIFVRSGGYTHHVVRQDQATILAGVAVDYDLGGL
jgi:hypothetical protein